MMINTDSRRFFQQEHICDSDTYTLTNRNARASVVGGRDRRVKAERGNVVTEYKVGNTRIKVCDNSYRDKTPEDIKEILSRIANRAQEQLTTQAYQTV